MEKISFIGLDLAKRSIQVHAAGSSVTDRVNRH